MLIAFTEARGVVHHEFLPQGQTMNHAFYIKVLKRLRQQFGADDLTCGHLGNGSSCMIRCTF